MIGSLVENWARLLKSGGAPELLDALDRVADVVFERARTIASDLRGESGWYELAINHPAGHAAFAWWFVANARDWVGDQFVLTMDDSERGRWERLLEDDTIAGAYGRVILGNATERLSSGDFPWAERVLFPKFAAEAGTAVAGPLWEGRLAHQRWSWLVVTGLRPYLRGFLQNTQTLVPAASEQVGDLVALLVSHPEEAGFSLPDLKTFIHHASLEARRSFAWALPRHLAELSPAGRKQVWTSVLAPYWRDRRTNVPVVLEPAETAAMIDWVMALPEVAAEVVNELSETDGEALSDADRILWDWREREDWVRDHPSEAAAVVKWLAERKSLPSWSADDAVKHLETALGAGAPRALVLVAAEAVAALGCTAAFALIQRIRKGE